MTEIELIFAHGDRYKFKGAGDAIVSIYGNHAKSEIGGDGRRRLICYQFEKDHECNIEIFGEKITYTIFKDQIMWALESSFIDIGKEAK